MLPRIFLTLGLDYKRLVVPSVTTEDAKLILSQFIAFHLKTHIDEMIEIIQKEVSSHAARYYIIVDNVSLISLSFQE